MTSPEEESDVVARVGVAGVDGEGHPEVPLGLRPVIQHRREVVVRQSVERPQPDGDKRPSLGLTLPPYIIRSKGLVKRPRAVRRAQRREIIIIIEQSYFAYGIEV